MSAIEVEILERLRCVFKPGSYYGPCSDADIDRAEKMLGVRLPLSYRVFLRHFGAAWLRPPFEVAGLHPERNDGPEPPQWPHVIDAASQTRRTSRGLIPQAYILISDDGGDYRLYLDTASMDANGECPVLALGPGLDGVEVAGSFLDFVEKAASSDPLANL